MRIVRHRLRSCVIRPPHGSVAGATGQHGARTVGVLESADHAVVRISRTLGVDLVSGEGLDATLRETPLTSLRLNVELLILIPRFFVAVLVLTVRWRRRGSPGSRRRR